MMYSETLPDRGRAGRPFPPPVDISRSLFRERVIGGIVSGGGMGKKCIIIEAQAGQGKTILAAQFLQRTGVPFVWYQMDPSDSDPLYFINAFLAAVRKYLPGFRVPLLETMMAKGELSSHEWQRYGDILLTGLGSFLDRDCYFVFDDLYFLEKSSPTLSLVAHLVRHASPRLRFLLVSRHPAWPEGQAPLPEEVYHLDNGELALSGNEIAELFNAVFEQPVTASQVRALGRATEGWAMGLTLVRRLGHFRTGEEAGDVLSFMGGTDFRSYFQQEVLSFVPERLRGEIFRLSLLRRIPLALAQTVTGNPHIGGELSGLVRLNFFIRALGDGEDTFVFHHLFGEIVKKRAMATLAPAESSAILHQAASWYEKRQQVEEALAYLLDAEDYEAVERLLREAGSSLLAANRVITLQRILAGIPEEIREDSAWLSYFQGAVLLEREPPAALPCFIRARRSFLAEGDERGELLATVMIVYFHAVVDSNFREGNRFIARAEELYHRLEDELDFFYRIQGCFTLAVGFCFFGAEMDKVEYFCDKAGILAKEADSQNLVAMVTAIYCQQHLFRSNWLKLRYVFDTSGVLLSSPHVSTINKVYFRIEIVSVLLAEGDFVNYQYWRSLFQRKASEYDLALQNATGPWLMIYEADRAIVDEKFDHALEIIRQSLSVPEFGSVPHFESYLLCYKSYVLAAEGRRDEAVTAAERALALRETAGGREYRMLGWLLVGASYGRLQMIEEAETYLGRAYDESLEIQDGTTYGGACLHRAALRLRAGRTAEAREDIAAVLTYLRENPHVRHFYCATPDIWRTVLAAAIENDIQADSAGKAAREILGIVFLPEIGFIPLLDITTLGRLRLQVAGAAPVRIPDLTQIQKRFLALLLSSPELAVEQEEIQTDLWPDSPPRKARSKFDNLMSRLRKVLGQAVAPHDIRHYLLVEKGTVRLRHCRVDHPAFARGVRKGLNHVRRGEPWQAGNAFYPAIRRWQGPYLAGLPLEERGETLRRELLELYLRAVRHWAEISAGFGDPEEGLAVAEKGLSQDPTNEPLVRLVYSLYTRTNNPVKAARCLRNYEKALNAEDFPPEEVAEIMEAFWRNSS